MEPCYPLPIKKETLTDLAQKAKDWALMHGIGMRPTTDSNKDTLVFAPFVLIPSPFPQKEFYKAKNAQKDLNEVIHKVAYNYNFLKECLSETIAVDDFTASLFRIYETVMSEGMAQPLSLGLVRSDYLLDTVKVSESATKTSPPTKLAVRLMEESFLKQVEINTIAAGFGWMGPIVNRLHRYILHELGVIDSDKHIPKNPALRGLSMGFVNSWKEYGVRDAIVLFVVEDFTVNICDQRMMEFDVRELNDSVRIVRTTLQHIAEHGTLKDKILYVDGVEVAVVYFRTGYVPEDYKSEKAWDVRLMIERSRAIKCPSIQYHLAGTKKVQQKLAEPNVLETFISGAERVAAIRALFTGLYSLDMDEDGDEMVKKAIEYPSKYVLKPQREGGGNNFYDDELVKILNNVQKSTDRTAYILMDRICPPPVTNYLIKPGSQPELCEMVSELGVFGVIIGSEENITYNEEVGHLLRTKQTSVNEGGVAAGFAALDSVYLL